jgi:hypothetical protein
VTRGAVAGQQQQQKQKQVMLVDITPREKAIDSNPHIRLLKTLQKHFRRVRPHQNVDKNPPSIRQARPRKSLKNIGIKHKSRSPPPPTHTHTAKILLSQISASLKLSNMTSAGHGLGVMTRLLKKRQSGSNSYKKVCFSLTQGC